MHFLSLLVLQVEDQTFTCDRLAFEAFPDALGHTFKISAEQMIRLLTAAALDKVARVLALKAIVRVL